LKNHGEPTFLKNNIEKRYSFLDKNFSDKNEKKKDLQNKAI